MNAAPVIEQDAKCSCGHSLRASRFDQRCPVCGKPAYESVQFNLDIGFGGTYANNKREQAVVRILDHVNVTGYPFEAFVFVAKVALYARRYMVNTEGHVTATEICKGLRDFALFHFGGRAKALKSLRRMYLKTSEDVGKVTFRLVKVGLLKAGDEDSHCSQRSCHRSRSEKCGDSFAVFLYPRGQSEHVTYAFDVPDCVACISASDQRGVHRLGVILGDERIIARVDHHHRAANLRENCGWTDGAEVRIARPLRQANRPFL